MVSCQSGVIHSFLLPVSDILYLATVHYVHSICMSNPLWPAAVVYGEVALPAFRKYYGQRNKVVGALLVR